MKYWVLLIVIIVASTKAWSQQQAGLDSLVIIKKYSDSLRIIIDSNNELDEKVIVGKTKKTRSYTAKVFFSKKEINKVSIKFETFDGGEELVYVHRGTVFCIVKTTESLYFTDDICFKVPGYSIFKYTEPDDLREEYYSIIHGASLLILDAD